MCDLYKKKINLTKSKNTKKHSKLAVSVHNLEIIIEQDSSHIKKTLYIRSKQAFKTLVRVK